MYSLGIRERDRSRFPVLASFKLRHLRHADALRCGCSRSRAQVKYQSQDAKRVASWKIFCVFRFDGTNSFCDFQLAFLVLRLAISSHQIHKIIESQNESWNARRKTSWNNNTICFNNEYLFKCYLLRDLLDFLDINNKFRHILLYIKHFPSKIKSKNFTSFCDSFCD